MKKLLRIVLTALSLMTVFASVSCSDVIFDEVRKEVKLDEPQVSGDIQSVIRYAYDDGSVDEEGNPVDSEKIFACSGKIYYKVASAGKCDWKNFENPSSGFVYKIAADKDNLYAVSLVISDDDDGYNVGKERILWKYGDNGWSKIYSEDYKKSAFIIFCTNSENKENRKAYFRSGSSVYSLNGDEKTEITTGSDDGTTIPTENVTFAAYFKDAVYFSSKAMCVNSDSSMLYVASGKSVSYSTDGSFSDENKVGLNCSTITSIACTKDYLILGTTSGIQHTALNDGIPDSSLAGWTNNAQSTLSSYYEIQSLLVIDSEKTEDEATIYASIDFSGSTSSSSAALSNVGLWSTYPEKDWNRE